MRDAGAAGPGLVLLLWLGACVAPLEAPSAFDDQQYLCGPENAPALEARLAECRATYDQCRGVISFRGVVDNQPVKVGSLITIVGTTDIQRVDGTTSRAFLIHGRAPYFTFSFDLPQFDAPPGHTKSGVYIPDLTNCLGTGNGLGCERAVLNLEVRGGTYLSSLDSLNRDIQIETSDELRVGLTGHLLRGGSVEACFALLNPGL